VLPHGSHADASRPVPARDTRTVNVCGIGGGAASAAPRASRDGAAWTYAMGGRDYTLDALSAQLGLEARARTEPVASGETARVLSRLTVLVRADRDAPYGLVQRLLTTCAELGIYRFEVAVVVPDALTQPAPGAR
jgi:hypothetical protein